MQRSTFYPPRWWWLALAAILVCAGVLRFTGYNFSLPYIDHVDEASYNIAARMVIDFGSPKPIGMHGYPPGIIAVNYFFVRLFQDPSTPPTTVTWMVRLVSVGFSLACIVALALLAFRVATPLAGLFAAAFWSFTPIIVEHSRYGTADNFVTFFSILAIFMALTGARYNRSRWVYAAIISEMLAILFKYQAIFLLPLVVAIPLWRLTDRTISRRAVLREFGVVLGLLFLFTFWLVFLFPSLEATSSPDWSAPNSKLAIPAPYMVWENFLVVYTQLESATVFLIGWLGLAALALREFRRRVDGFGLLVVAASALAWLVGMSFYGSMGSQQFRQFIAAGAFLYVLRAVGWIGWVFLLGWALERIGLAPKRRWSLASGAVALVMFGLGIPAIQGSINNAINHTLPDRRNELAHWMDISLPSGTYIAETENHKVFNRDWGGYAGITQFPFYKVAQLNAEPIETWRADGVEYAIVSNSQYAALGETPEGRAELDQTLRVKTFPPSSAYRGPDMVVLRLYPMQHSAEGQLGTLRLVGYDLNAAEAQPGDTLTFTLYWQADAPTNAEYVVYNHLLGASGEMVAQVDGDPLPDLRRPTTSWDDPDETLVSRPFSLTIPADAAPGTYQLISGFYRREGGERLLTPDGADSLTIATIQVD